MDCPAHSARICTHSIFWIPTWFHAGTGSSAMTIVFVSWIEFLQLSWQRAKEIFIRMDSVDAVQEIWVLWGRDFCFWTGLREIRTEIKKATSVLEKSVQKWRKIPFGAQRLKSVPAATKVGPKGSQSTWEQFHLQWQSFSSVGWNSLFHKKKKRERKFWIVWTPIMQSETFESCEGGFSVLEQDLEKWQRKVRKSRLFWRRAHKNDERFRSVCST